MSLINLLLSVHCTVDKDISFSETMNVLLCDQIACKANDKPY